jgi:L-asparagine transporter-like permease
MEKPRVQHFPIRLPFSPYAQIAALMAFAVIALSTFFVEGLKYSVPSFLPFLLVITPFYWTLKRSSRRKPSGRSEPWI